MQRFAASDEIRYRKRHRYLTVVVDHDTGNVIWAGDGRSAETLDPFFELLGPEGCAALETVTMDMAAGYQKAVRTKTPAATSGRVRKIDNHASERDMPPLAS